MSSNGLIKAGFSADGAQLGSGLKFARTQNGREVFAKSASFVSRNAHAQPLTDLLALLRSYSFFNASYGVNVIAGLSHLMGHHGGTH